MARPESGENAQRPTPNPAKSEPRRQNDFAAESLDSNYSASDLITFHKSTVSIPRLRTARRNYAQDATNFRTDCPTPNEGGEDRPELENRSPRMGRWTLNAAVERRPFPSNHYSERVTSSTSPALANHTY